jgi:hypothetical protein
MNWKILTHKNKREKEEVRTEQHCYILQATFNFIEFISHSNYLTVLHN